MWGEFFFLEAVAKALGRPGRDRLRAVRRSGPADRTVPASPTPMHAPRHPDASPMDDDRRWLPTNPRRATSPTSRSRPAGIARAADLSTPRTEDDEEDDEDFEDEPRTVLITGACGNIGRKLRAAWADVYDLVLIDRAADPDDPEVIAADLAELRRRLDRPTSTASTR